MKICKNYEDFSDYKSEICVDGAYLYSYNPPQDFPCIVSFDLTNFRLDGNVTNPIIRRELKVNIIYIKDLKSLMYRDDFEELIKKE